MVPTMVGIVSFTVLVSVDGVLLRMLVCVCFLFLVTGDFEGGGVNQGTMSDEVFSYESLTGSRDLPTILGSSPVAVISLYQISLFFNQFLFSQ
jgi:hypothetical protein